MSVLLREMGPGLCRSRALVVVTGRASSSKIEQPMVAGPDKDGGVVPAPKRSGVQAAMRKGAGGRNSFSGIVCTIFGAGGHTGKYVAARLGKMGCQLIFPYRSDPYCIRHLKQAGDLGQTLFFPFHLNDDDSIRKCIKYSNVVINMIGAHHNTPNFSLFDTNGHGAGRIARLCKEMGVEKLIQVSALNASPEPKEYIIPGGSEFLRSKALGEQLVRDAFPEAIIARPARMYGDEGDMFLGSYAYYLRGYYPKNFDVWRRGEETIKMPLYAPNIADGIEKLVLDPTLVGQTVEFVGAVLAMCDFRAEWSRRRPYYNTEIVENTECVTDALTGVPTLTDIGVRNLKVFEIASRSFLDREYSRVGDNEYAYGECEIPPAPLRVPPVYTDEALQRRPGYTRRRVFDETSLHSTTPASGNAYA